MIVKAYEFMIFNYVYVSGEIVCLDRVEFRISVIEDKCENIVPIPLTNYWFRDVFDFVYDKQNRCWKIDTKRGELVVNMTDGDEYYISMETNDIILDYVHQLQNASFVLKGRELTDRQKIKKKENKKFCKDMYFTNVGVLCNNKEANYLYCHEANDEKCTFFIEEKQSNRVK